MLSIYFLSPAEVLPLLGLLETVFLETNGLDTDESGGVHGAEVLESVHAGLELRVQVLSLARSALDVDVALVAHQADLAVDALLAEEEGVLDELAFGGEVHAVVKEGGPGVCDELIPQCANLAIEDETFQIHMCQSENSHSGRIVAATALESDEAVLDDIDSANTVGLTELVQCAEELEGVGMLALWSDQLDWQTLLEFDCDVG